jgi:hypothetical protein
MISFRAPLRKLEPSRGINISFPHQNVQIRDGVTTPVATRG